SIGSHVKSLVDSLEQLRRQMDAHDVALGRARLEAAGAGRRAAEALHRVEAVTADDVPAIRERTEVLGATLSRLEERIARLDARIEQHAASAATGRTAADRLTTEVRDLRVRLDAVVARLAEPRDETLLRRLYDRAAALGWVAPGGVVASLAAHF